MRLKSAFAPRSEGAALWWTAFPWLLLILLLLAAPGSAHPSPHINGQAGPRAALVTGVGAIGMTVSDMDRSIRFYSQVLSFKKVSDAEVNNQFQQNVTEIISAAQGANVTAFIMKAKVTKGPLPIAIGVTSRGS